MESLKNFFTPEVLWFMAGILLLILEFTAPGLVIFFFGIGAIVVGAVCLLFHPSFTIQLVIFLSASLILLFSLRKWLKKVFIGRKSELQSEIIDTLDSFVGEKAVVIEKITPEISGAVELHGTPWKAESDQEIRKGTTVKVIGKKNLILQVKPIQ